LALFFLASKCVKDKKIANDKGDWVCFGIAPLILAPSKSIV